MQRRARPVCSGSQGPGAGNQLASVSEIRAGGGGGGHWANTQRPPQSPVLDSARGSADQAATLLREAGWRGRPGPPPPPGWWGSARAPGEAWPPGPASRWGPLQGDRHQAEEQSNFFSLPMLRILHPFLKLTRGGRTPIKIGLVQKVKVREGEREGGGRESRAGEGLRGRERGKEREEGRRVGETQAWSPLVPRTVVGSPSRAGSKPPLSPHP